MNICYTIEITDAKKLPELQQDLLNYNADEKKKIKDRISIVKNNKLLSQAFNKISQLITIEQLDAMADMDELNSYSVEKIGTGRVYEIIFNFNAEKIKLLNQLFKPLGILKSKREAVLKKQTRECLAFYGKILSEEIYLDSWGVANG